MAKLSGELIHTLEILPNIELNEVVKYIDVIKRERRVEKAKDYKNALTKIFFSMIADGFTEIKFVDLYSNNIECFNLITTDIIEIT